ncbi:hypothetical protein LZ009_04820 [Ramlibacter sp. XY19]|uniref:hypothetical protein n=1 Tax=Ramlibacter paludis TaxID=2908000 RepID=UPI0023D9E3B6|nr:hypothetical protein [Ramlibacter paludis]MCG2592099.1 hypothetical protein [Ramlibacter paludis]
MARLPLVLSLAGIALVLGACSTFLPGMSGMGFFVTSANPGKGADFGGIAGADRYCQTLADGVGQGRKTWRAYLSTTGAGGVNARDRIGAGPWSNAKGQLIASNVNELHGANGLTKQSALTERGEMVMGRGDAVNLHDILTGSGPDGRAMPGTADTTCGNWTKSGEGSAIVGHHDRQGLRDDEPSKSWNSSHPTRGCGMEALKSTGGGGLLYCFAAN